MNDQALENPRNIHRRRIFTDSMAASAVDDAAGHESESAFATTPVLGCSVEEAVHSGEVSAGRLRLESAEAIVGSSSADLALLVWPVVNTYAPTNPEIAGAEKWTHASMGPWSVPEELAQRVKVVVASVGDVVIAAWGVGGFDCRERTLPAGVVDLGCTFELEFDPRADALIGRTIYPSIHTNIFMYAELDKLLRFGSHHR